MSQQSEERSPESTSPDVDASQSARILHMKSTPYDLQRAIQQRAQESVEREAELDREQRRPKPLKWLIAFAIASIPIVLTLFAVDGFLRVFHRYLNTVSTQQQQQAQQAASESQAASETTLQSSQPGVVLLQPMNAPEPAPAEPDAAERSSSASAQPSKTN